MIYWLKYESQKQLPGNYVTQQAKFQKIFKV